MKTSLSLKAASQPRLLLSNQLSLVFALPCSLQTAGMPWVWPQAALQTLRSQPRGSMVSSWRAGGVRAGFSQHNSCVCLPQVLLHWPPGRVLHPCPCQHPTQDLEPPHMAGPSCQCSATLCVAAKLKGDPQVPVLWMDLSPPQAAPRASTTLVSVLSPCRAVGSLPGQAGQQRLHQCLEHRPQQRLDPGKRGLVSGGATGGIAR